MSNGCHVYISGMVYMLINCVKYAFLRDWNCSCYDNALIVDENVNDYMC